MDTVQATRSSFPRSWVISFASLLPLWLLSLAISVEGFPRPPIPGWLGIVSFIGFITSGIVLFWKKWITIELLLYSLLPFALLSIFDEISTTYKTPFIFSCAVLLSAGAVIHQRTRRDLLRWTILLAMPAVMLWAAGHAMNEFWQMASALGYHECFPDYTGCAPLTGTETPWWRLFIG